MSIKITAVLTAFLLLFSMMTACSSGNSEKTPVESSSDVSEKVESTSSEQTTAELHTEEKAAIKNTVMALMQDDGKPSPLGLLGVFDNRDYCVTDFNDNNDFAASLSKVYSRDGVTAICYDDGTATFTAFGDNKKVEAVGEFQEDGSLLKTAVGSITEYDTSAFVPSVLFDFGIDVSEIVGSADSDDDDGILNLPLTAEMLTVSDDLAKCVFSKEYLDEVVKILAASRVESEDERAEFISDTKASGEYSVADNTVTFTFQFNDSQLGETTLKTELGYNDRNEEFYSVTTSFNVKNEGITVPTESKIYVYGVEYSGDKPVSVIIDQSVNASYSTDYNGAKLTVSSYVQNLYYVNIKDENAPILDVSTTTETTTGIGREQRTDRNGIDLTIGVGAPNMFTYRVIQSSIETVQVEGTISFDSADIPVIPEQVLSEIGTAW